MLSKRKKQKYNQINFQKEQKRGSAEGKKLHLPHFYVSVRKADGGDRLFSPVPELLEAYTHKIILY